MSGPDVTIGAHRRRGTQVTHNDDDEPTLAELLEQLTGRPTAADIDHRATDLINRAQLVEHDGWDDYRYTWSSGEVSGTALLLGDLEVLALTHDTEHTALETWAANLWGITDGQRDTDNGFERTRAWFYALRQQLTDPTEGTTR